MQSSLCRRWSLLVLQMLVWKIILIFNKSRLSGAVTHVWQNVGKMHRMSCGKGDGRRQCGRHCAWTSQWLVATGPNYKSDSERFLFYSHIPFACSLNLSRVARAAMEVKFGSIWQQVGAFRTPTYAKPFEDLFLLARSRRGGLARRALTHPTTLRRREEKMARDDEEEGRESDGSGDIDALVMNSD